MYKAILVDDENYDLEGLNKLIPWMELNIEVVCSANKPTIVLDYIQHNPVDLLITDIKMPVYSGIELAKLALEHNPQLSVIFISGYEDFQYAREALQLKASGYILKPVDDDEIISVLKATVAHLDSQKLRQRAEINLKQSFHYVKGNFVIHILEGTYEEDKLEALMQEYDIDLPKCSMTAVIAEIDDVTLKLNPSTVELQRLEVQNVLHCARDYVKQHELGLYCNLSHFQFGLIIYTTNYETMVVDLNGLVRHIKENSTLSITLGIGFDVIKAEQLWKSFHHAKEMLNLKMFLGKNRLITSQTTKINMVPDAKNFNEILETMFLAIENYGLVKIDDCIEELFILAKGFEHRVTVYNFAIHIISKIDTFLNKRNETFQSLLGWDMDHLNLIYKFETIDDIQSWLRRTMFSISEMVYFRRYSKNSKLFEDVLNYVQSRFSNDVTLRDVANYFSYSPNHLGFLFKEYFKESFSDCVIRMRMEKAAQLLLNPRLKIYEIADQLGYKSLTYFSRQFREFYGTSPGDYRKQG
jgi:two-component system response regulator YesN